MKSTDTKRLGRALPLLAFLAYALLALATTHPLWQHLTSALPSDIGDPLLNTWIQAWDNHALLTHPFQLFDANVFYPLPNTLAYSEHLTSTALVILPLQALTGEPVLAYNLSLLLSYPLAGLGMYLLVLHWTRRHGPAFLAGLAFAFAPYRLAAIAHLQLLTVQWLPFTVLALDLLLAPPGAQNRAEPPERGPTKRFPAVALFVIFATLQVLASWYLAVFSILILGLYTLCWVVAHWRHSSREWLRSLLRLAVASLIVALLVLPFALPYLEVLPQLRAARPITWALSFAARPTDFLTAAPHLRFTGALTRFLAERQGFTEENTLFLGLVALILSLVGAALGRPRWRTIALVGILIASLALTFAGPYQALTRLFPLLAVVRVPPRWIIPATFVLAALAGYGLAAIQKNTPRWAVLAAASLLLVAESFAAPLPLAQVGSRADQPQVYQWLAAADGQRRWAVVEIPMHVAPAPEYPETKRMYTSSLGWWGLVNGYSGFTPERQSVLGARLANFPSDDALSALRDLAMDGVRYLIVHPDEAPLERDRWEEHDRWWVERQTTLLPMGRFGPQELYLINPYGDSLITEPSIATDAYWSANKPVLTDIQFGPPGLSGEIRLLAYSYQPGDAFLDSKQPAEARLTLYWQTTVSLDTDYTVFVHSLHADGQLAGQSDGPPVANHHPTTAWQPGEIVQDSRLVPAGERFLVGLYDVTSGERLPAFTADGARLPDDAVVITFNEP